MSPRHEQEESSAPRKPITRPSSAHRSGRDALHRRLSAGDPRSDQDPARRVPVGLSTSCVFPSGVEEAFRLGLADRLAEPGRLRETARRLAAEIAASAPIAVRSIRATLRGDLAERVRKALDHELAEQKIHWATRDSAEGIRASLERRAPVFTGE